MPKTLQFKQQIYVYPTRGPDSTPALATVDTIEQASQWIQDHGDMEAEYTIDGTPEAWHEQMGYCGGSSICDCS